MNTTSEHPKNAPTRILQNNITVQQIMAGLRTLETEDDRFTVFMRAIFGWVM
jgi:hypothetical protein